MLRDLRSNLLKGLGLALFVATGFSAWVTFLRVAYGTTAFDRLHTTYGAVVALYYLGGLAAGVLLGVFWPLRRWLPGSALLGMLAVFPLYFGVAFTDSPRSGVFTSDNLTRSLVLAFLVGVPLGVWAWHDDHPGGPTWFDALRYPSSRTAGKLWVAVLPVAGVSYILLPKWTGNWPSDLVILLAFVLFVIPILVAVLVTLAAARRRGA